MQKIAEERATYQKAVESDAAMNIGEILILESFNPLLLITAPRLVLSGKGMKGREKKERGIKEMGL